MRLVRWLFSKLVGSIRWTFRKILSTVTGLIKGLTIALGIVVVVGLVHLTNEFFDFLDTPIYGNQEQKMEQPLPNFYQGDYDRQLPEPLMRSALIGLYRKDKHGKMQFHCSAFVISNVYAITASHCLVDESDELLDSRIYVYDSALRNTGIIAKAATIDTRADLGAMVGDFRNFKKLKMNYEDGMSGLKPPFFACGFPWGSTPAVCNQFQIQGPYYDKVKGAGFLHPGMSGGPVIDSTGKVGAVNIGVGDGFVFVAPVIGIFPMLKIRIK